MALAFACATLSASDYIWKPDQSPSAPEWIAQLSPQSQLLGETRFQIQSPDRAGLALAATLFYEEQTGGFLRVFWGAAGSQTAMTLNLYEGVGMSNRRTILLKMDSISAQSYLTLQSFNVTTGIEKIHFQWIEPTTVFQSASADPIVLIDQFGDVFHEEEAKGGYEPIPRDEWRDQVVIAPLIFEPTRIEDGVAFQFELVEAPKIARLVTEISGLAPDRSCEVWLNGVFVGILQTPVPSLLDPGYDYDELLENWSWTGWRKGSLLLKSDSFQNGLNEVIIHQPSLEAESSPIALKNLKIEFRYGGEAATEKTFANEPEIWNETSSDAPEEENSLYPAVQLQFMLPQLDLNYE